MVFMLPFEQMNAITSLFGHLVAFGMALFLIGLGFSLIVGQSRLAKRYVQWVGKTLWKSFRWTLKTMIGLAIDLMKLVHSKL